MDKRELDRLEKATIRQLDQASWLMLCGSIPPGVPPDIYVRLIETARKKKVQTILDTDGEALEVGLEAKPTVVHANQAEAERVLDTALLTRASFLDAARKLRAMGAGSVILSLGSRGAVGADAKSMTEALPPRVDAVCPIGAGDALAAAFTWAMEKGANFQAAVRRAVPTGDAAGPDWCGSDGRPACQARALPWTPSSSASEFPISRAICSPKAPCPPHLSRHSPTT